MRHPDFVCKVITLHLLKQQTKTLLHAIVIKGSLGIAYDAAQQRVHIGPEQDGLAAFDGCPHAGLQAAGTPFDAVFGQPFLDFGAGLKFFPPCYVLQ